MAGNIVLVCVCVCMGVCVFAWVCVGVGGIPVLVTTLSMVLFENQFFGIIKVVILIYRSIRCIVLSLVNSHSTIGLLTNIQHFEPFRVIVSFPFGSVSLSFLFRFVSVLFPFCIILSPFCLICRNCLGTRLLLFQAV